MRNGKSNGSPTCLNGVNLIASLTSTGPPSARIGLLDGEHSAFAKFVVCRRPYTRSGCSFLANASLTDSSWTIRSSARSENRGFRPESLLEVRSAAWLRIHLNELDLRILLAAHWWTPTWRAQLPTLLKLRPFSIVALNCDLNL